MLKGKSEIEFIAVEPKAAPTMTRGKYMYDYGGTGELTPLLKMHSIGHKYRVPPIHAGGLRYHGVAPTISILVNHDIVKTIAYHQNEVFKAAVFFAKHEGVIPSPESAHAVKAAIDIARNLKRSKGRKVIPFNLSGHGLLDLSGYQEYLEGELPDYEPERIDLTYLLKIQ